MKATQSELDSVKNQNHKHVQDLTM